MTDTDLTTEAFARDLAARFGRTFVETVEAGRVRDFLAALDEPMIADGAPVPPLFLLSLARQRRPHLAQSTGSGGVNAGDAFRFFAPVHVGDTLTITTTVTRIEAKAAKSGGMLLAVVRFDYVNQHGQKVATRDNSLIRWSAA